MKAELKLTEGQVQDLLPLLKGKGSGVLVANIYPSGGNGWNLSVHLLPAERRDSIRAACAGTLSISKQRKPRTTKPELEPTP